MSINLKRDSLSREESKMHSEESEEYPPIWKRVNARWKCVFEECITVEIREMNFIRTRVLSRVQRAREASLIIARHIELSY